jgi:magnesium chelatase accessory protein
MKMDRVWLDWATHGRSWPHHRDSQFFNAGGYRWHVQDSGPKAAPVLLLLHGTGAASFSWRHLHPLLSERFRLIVPDLPCHGFTQPLGGTDLSLDGMTKALEAMLRHMDVRPTLIFGHSAGAVIGISLALAMAGNRAATQDLPCAVLSINGALTPIRGNRLLSPVAKLLFANPISAGAFSLLAKSTPLGSNLLSATGSRIDHDGERIYRLLMSSSGHVRGAMGMMASWNLDDLPDRLRRLQVPLALLAARDDPMVSAKSSETAAAMAKRASLKLEPTGGHLLHECDAQCVADWIDHVHSLQCEFEVEAS